MFKDTTASINGDFHFREIRRDYPDNYGIGLPSLQYPKVEVLGHGEGVSVRIEGTEGAIQAILSKGGWATRILSAINRLLTLLGYQTEQDREKALARFLAWLAFVEAYVGSQDSEVKATWTEAALRAIGSGHMLTTTGAAEEAALLADGLIAQQLMRFPPREPMAAPGCECAASDEWQHATGCASPEDAEAQRERTGAALQRAVQDAISRDNELSAWRQAGTSIGCDSLSDFAHQISEILDELNEWRQTAKQRGWDKPSDLRGHAATDGKAWAETIKERDAARSDCARPNGIIEQRDADLLKYAAEIDELRKQVADRDVIIGGITSDILGGDGSKQEDWLNELRRADDALSDAKGLLTKTLNVESSHSLLHLTQGIAELVAGRTRAAETLAEREASKLRADYQQALRELATVREERDKAGNAAHNAQRREDEVRTELETAKSMLYVEQKKRGDEQRAREDAELEREVWRGNFNAYHKITSGIRDAWGIKGGAYCDLVALAKSAIVPQQKPDRVEKGQRWAFVMTCSQPYMMEDAHTFTDHAGFKFTATAIDMSAGIYLGSF